MVRRVPEAQIVEGLMEELARWEAENKDKLPAANEAEGLGRRKLPVVAG
jgi:(E)-4-hydroxy-3-methylbut-2-enyl-diphosphate synthase